MAIKNNDYQLVEKHLDDRVYVDCRLREMGETNLIYAIELERPEIVRLLLSRGANLNVTDAFGQSVADYVAKSENAEIKDLFASL